MIQIKRLLGFLVALAVTNGGVVSGQTRTPVRPQVTATRPPTPPTQVHGNNLNSNRPQVVYGITKTNNLTGITRLEKFGVSSGTVRGSGSTGRSTLNPARGYSTRALTQTRSFNKPANSDGYTYSTRILQKIPAQPSGQMTSRSLATLIEKQLVTKARVKDPAAVPRNILPRPFK